MPQTALGRAVAQRGRAWLDQPPANPTTVDLSDDLVTGATPEPVREAAVAALHQHLGDHYTRRPGIAPLCKAVADQLTVEGVDAEPNNGVVITGGAQEARFVAIRALAPGHTVWMPTPSPIPAFADAARFAGATIQPFDPAGEPAAMPGDLLVISNPNPATGQVYDPGTLERLAEWAARSDLVVIADETAAPLLKADVAFRRFAALPGMAERTLTLGSFAGTPGMLAWQVAWFAGPKPLAVKVRDLKQSMTICSPALSQYAALGGAPAAERGADATQIEQLTALLRELGVPFAEPHTRAFVVADVAALGGGDAVAAACAAQGVRVASGAPFGAATTVRITASDALAGARDRLTAALRALQTQQVTA